MHKILLTLTALLLALPLAAKDGGKTKVACVGNSVTFGYGLAHRDTDAYPVRLQQMLGDAYDVRNFGHSGATLLRHGHRPYHALPEYQAAIDFAADIVIIHLGLNDTDPRNWPQYGDEFVADYRALIDAFRTANAKAQIYLCVMTPIFHDHRRFDSGTREWHGLINARIRQIAATTGCGLIDLYTPLHCRPDLFPDALHPNAEGAAILARTVYSGLTGNYGGLRLPAIYGDGMVVQREKDIVFRGTANAGEKVSVTFGREKRTTTAAPDGTWRVTFAPRTAGGPYEARIKARSGERRLSDIWVGEVWLCSGQSNMELRVNETLSAQADMAAADTLTRVHLYDMPAICATYAVVWDSARLDSVNRLQYLRDGRWRRPTAKGVARFSSIAYNFARMLADSLQCHVGVISNAVGGSTTEGWIDRSTLEEHMPGVLRQWKHNDYVMGWARERALYNTKNATSPLQRHPYEPAYLYENGIAPIAGFPLRGVLWYQGESNAHNIELHERLFTLLEQSWRRAWHDASLPFHFVQLSGLSTRPSWPSFRDSQRRLADRLPQTWMAVSSDLGDSLDVHPRRKYEVARRLTVSALAHTYGRPTVGNGPHYDGFRTEGRTLRALFSTADGLRAADGAALRGFEVAGEDGVFHPAKARIDGTTVVLESPEVKRPCAVRYAYRPYTDANLVNGAGLPASTFIDEPAFEGAKAQTADSAL